MDKKINTKRILIFLAFAVGINWIGCYVLYLLIGREDPLRAGVLANIFALTSPTLANLATRLITREGWKNTWLRPNFRRGWRYYLAAWLLPVLAACVGAVIYFLVFPQSFDANAGAAREAVASIPALAGASPWMLVLISLVNTLIVGLVYSSLLSIGEEFGWRAYLLQKLVAHFTGVEPVSGSTAVPVPAERYLTGARKAALLTGLIWGVWHWPGIILFTMKVDPTMPLISLLVYLVMTCSAGVLLAWVTLRSGSVWPASIGHGLLNASNALSTNVLHGSPNILLGPLPSSLVGGLGYMALALVLLFSHRALAWRNQPAGADRWQTQENPTLV